MKRIIASVTERGQVTIPAEVRRALAAKARGKVIFEIDGDEVRLLPVMTLDETAGSVKPMHRPEDFNEISRVTKEELVERYLEKFPRS